MCFQKTQQNNLNDGFALQGLSSEDRAKILFDIAASLEANEGLIMVENDLDVAAAGNAGYDRSLISRLALTPWKASSCKIVKICAINYHQFMRISFHSFLV